jgi:hypothetical protein
MKIANLTVFKRASVEVETAAMSIIAVTNTIKIMNR